MFGFTDGRGVQYGSQEEVSIHQLAEKVANFADDVEYSFTEGYHGDVSRRLPDVTNSENLLGWQAKTTLDEGLAMMWESLNS